MTVDTLKLGAFVDVDLADLPDHWRVTAAYGGSAPDKVTARVRTVEGIECCMYQIRDHAEPWVTIETSIPKLLDRLSRGRAFAAGARDSVGTPVNDQLLEWADVDLGAWLMVQSAEHAFHAHLPAPEMWKVRRIDAVWAWPCDPAPYIEALSLATIPFTSPVRFPTMIRWNLPQSGVVARVYDKGAEQHRSVALPLRVERQARLADQVVTSDGVAIEGTYWGHWTGQDARGIVRDLVHAIGLDRPIRTIEGTRARLVAVHGRTKGNAVLRAMLDARECGGWKAIPGSAASAGRYRLLAAKAGITTFNDVELPPLNVDDDERRTRPF